MTSENMVRRSQSRRLQLESLERRELMAGDVLAAMHGQMLVIFGDAADNGVVLTYNSNTRSYQVHGRDAGGSPTTINGVDTSDPDDAPAFTGVQHVAVLLNGGHDSFEVGSPEAVDTVINKWLSIDMGEGDDDVVLGRAGTAAGGSGPVATRLRTGTSINVNLGAGNDHLEIAHADIGLWLNVWAGDGDDEVIFATEYTATGSSETQIFPVRVRNNASIELVGGDDTLAIRHTAFNKHLRILDSAGAADITLYNVSIGQKLDIDTSNEGDAVNLQFVNAKTFTLDTNGGVDDVDVRDCRFKTMNVKLGAARDKLLLRGVRVSLATHLDGGQQGSSLTRGPGNQLRGLAQRNLG